MLAERGDRGEGQVVVGIGVGQGASAHPPKRAVAVEHLKISSNGGRAHAELSGEVANAGRTREANPAHDLRMPEVLKHGRDPISHFRAEASMMRRILA
ncbi:hypothetical protein GCM10010404_77960 [Nonomuraea africana]